MGETRVNLGHLLEDLRDSYPFPQEEAIVVELIANALDSGASTISFVTEPREGAMAIIDNGAGMTPSQLEEYHDVAATTKLRGKGIGFAGVGAKLALLIAEEVATETRRGNHHRATRWRMESSLHAPWEYVAPPGLIDSGHGTAVAIQLHDHASNLTKPAFIADVIRRHYLPLLVPQFVEVLRSIYEDGVSFLVNGKPVQAHPADGRLTPWPFLVRTGKRKKPVGIGFIRKADADLPEEEVGIGVSTYGKVIKRGWDWIGLLPQNPMKITGLVEVPELSEILTLNKADFLRDAASLQKYYRYRKAIQHSLEPILRQMGEIREPRQRPAKDLDPLQLEIERVLADLVNDFPEISPLLDRRRRGDPTKGLISDPNSPAAGTLVVGVDIMTGTPGGAGEGEGLEVAGGVLAGEGIEASDNPTEPGREHEGRKRKPGVMIGFDDSPDRQTIAWIVENTIWVNRSNPAYLRVMDTNAEPYHIILAVSWVLSSYLEDGKSPQDFIGRFISSWGNRA